MYHKLIKVQNLKKNRFEHSKDTYYRIDLSDDVKLMFTALEINKAFDRYKRWVSKNSPIEKDNDLKNPEKQ